MWLIYFNIWMKSDMGPNSLIFCDAYVSSYGLLSLSGGQRALLCWRQIPRKVDMLVVVNMLLVNILAEGIRTEDILGEGILDGNMRTKNCDFVDNPLGCLGLTLDKTKRHP